MSKPIRVLIVEDSEDDVLILLRHLRRNGFSPIYEVVETAEAMRAALKKQQCDVIISDYSMPNFDGLTALQTLKETGLDLPFIIVSGVIGEEVAVSAMRAGAHDYLMKNNLTRLIPAIERELQEATERRQRRLAEQALRESEKRYKMATEAGNVGVWDWNLETDELHLDPKLKAMLGYEAHEIQNHMDAWLELVHPDDRSKVTNQAQKHLEGALPIYEIEHRIVHKDGSVRWFLARGTALRNASGEPYRMIGTDTDITDRKGAEEALHKALSEVKQLKNQLQAENIYLQEEIKTQYNFEEIIGTSPALQKVFQKIEQVASTDASVLITGETGSGKELIARAVHNRSKRADKVLVKVNCAALPENLIESELFGHEKGAFTGALARNIGRFELADQGTIFLDEIGDLPLGLQTKLLRVLQEGEFERVGGSKTLRVDVRVIAATNRDLENAVRNGDFREDLYYRLNVFPIHSPPLRERKEDIPILAKHFCDKSRAKIGKNVDSVDQKVMDALLAYDWPGNVRELENTIERALILTQGNRLKLGDWLPQRSLLKSPTSSQSGASHIPTIWENEKEYITRVLEMTNWRVRGEKGAAKILDLHPSTLESRMKKLNIKRKS
ncbi:PAS domain-containing protein [candidate division KSB1 bacterium]|nr:PAS domain-containing protein [candidate division KSB1 bacterium]NIR70861.1 PAS domain-containing protein [candidate division KSB1 bacterium]NIS24647.1 PAS domain-containing protein [candidate division KSB1 bacterium]NIT71549.1 PAS domain-containing protein [candidate division KSB1 bacterium]NIU25247.1 PAS domain-containing protein [candidate division KSB1 bacterium]